MFGFKAQHQFRLAMSLHDGSVHKNQTNKIVAITFPIISKTWSFLKLLAIQTKQSNVTLAATKNFIQLPSNLLNFLANLWVVQNLNLELLAYVK